MKRVITFIILFIMPLSLYASAPQKELVFSTHNYPPFSFVDESNNATGPFVDILTLACKRLNYKCEFISVPNRRSKLMLKNLQAQGNFPMGWNIDRNEWLYFSIPLMKMQYGFFQPEGAKKTIKSLNDLQKMQIAVFGPSNASFQLIKIQQQMIKDGLREFDIVLLTDANGTGVKMIENNRIDGYFANTLQARARLKQFNLHHVNLAFLQSESPYFIGFNKIQLSSEQIALFNKALLDLYQEHDQFKDILKPYNIDPILITPEILSRFNIITD